MCLHNLYPFLHVSFLTFNYLMKGFLPPSLPASPSGRVHPLLGRFSELGALLSRLRLQPGSVDAVLLDAGCSSMQMDCPERGFSLSKDGPLDMRMDADRWDHALSPHHSCTKHYCHFMSITMHYRVASVNSNDIGLCVWRIH